MKINQATEALEESRKHIYNAIKYLSQSEKDASLKQEAERLAEKVNELIYRVDAN